MTDFAQLLLRSLPGIYRQKDDPQLDGSGDLASFLQIAASPLAELETSIGQLYDDLFGATARADFLRLIGDLIGADIDPTLPESLQRAALADTLAFYRSKGLAEPLANTVQASTGWQTVAVDYSQVVARLPFVEALFPLARRRGQPVGVASGGTNRFTFDATGRVAGLYDEARGRVIARTEIATLAADLVGTDRGFAIRDSGVDLVGPRAPSPRTVLAANLTDFAAPLKPDGTALSVGANQVAVDPELGRMLFGTPVPNAGNLSVDFHQLVPTSSVQTLDIRNSQRMLQLGRSDDRAPYTLDLRAPARPGDRIGRTHFDNHGLFLTVGRRLDLRRPNLLRAGTPTGFSFDDRPLATGDAVGNLLQLQDAIDGSPLTLGRTGVIGKFVDHEVDYADTQRGFTIRVRGVSLLDPSFGGRVVAANLVDLASPKDPHDPSGATALTLQTKDVAVDPQRGRFLVNLTAFGISADDLRVGYSLTSALTMTGATPAVVGAPGSNIWSFAPGGTVAPLRDAFDGTPLRIKLRFGASLINDLANKPRGFRILAGTTNVTATLTAQDVILDGPSASPPAGQLHIDVDRGRFALPPGTVSAGTALSVDFTAADTTSESRVFDSLAQRLPGLMPAGIVPVVVDTRRTIVDPANFELLAKVTTP